MKNNKSIFEKPLKPKTDIDYFYISFYVILLSLFFGLLVVMEKLFPSANF